MIRSLKENKVGSHWLKARGVDLRVKTAYVSLFGLSVPWPPRSRPVNSQLKKIHTNVINHRHSPADSHVSTPTTVAFS